MPWQDKFSTREEYLAEVKRLVLQVGLSYSKAAEAMGCGITKNSVVRAMQTILGRARSTVKFPDSVWPSEPRSKSEKAGEAASSPVHLNLVRDGQCRAPLWPDFLHSKQRVDPSEHMLCGKKCREGSAWCDEHHMAFFPPEMQRRKRRIKSNDLKDNSAHFE